MPGKRHTGAGSRRQFVARMVAVLGLLPVLWQSNVSAAEQQPQRISRPGQYQGYSQSRFDGWRRTSQYVTMRDGTRIAIDIFRPTGNSVLHEEPLPVIWEQRRYQRASIDPGGSIHSQLDRPDHPLRKLVPHGYIFAVADVRGAGASSGTRVDPTPPQESLDAYGITEGCLRASHRALSQPPHVRLGLPYHSGLEGDTARLPDEPVELVFDLLPTAKHFPAGHRVRIAVTGADKDSYQTPQPNPAPTITVLRDAQHPSYAILPAAD